MSLTLLTTCAVLYWIGWERLPGLASDQGWPLQVARRVASGDVLYRDVLWAYGPLPILLLAAYMRVGNADVVFHSVLQIASALLAGLILHRLYRYRLSPRGACVATLVALLVFGASGPFLFTYTPGITLGILGMLMLLFGLVESLAGRSHTSSMLAIAAGLAVTWLSKPEFAFAASILGVLMLAAARFTWSEGPARNVAGRIIGLGLLCGAIAALGVFAWLASRAGWGAVAAGLSGYQHLQLSGWKNIGYYGLDTVLSTAAGAILLAILALALGSAPDGIRQRIVPAARRILPWLQSARRRRVLVVVLFCIYVTAVLAWQSGWLGDVRHGRLPLWDVTALAAAVAIYPLELSLFLRSQLFLAISLAEWLLLLLLLPRWLRRLLRREQVTFEQLASLSALVYCLSINLRFILLGIGLWDLPILVLLLTLLPAEFPRLRWRVWLTRPRAVVVGLLALALASGGVEQIMLGLEYQAEISTPHGPARVSSSTAAALARLISYINTNTKPEDPVAIFGPFPGLYYAAARPNPFRQDYMLPGLADTPLDAADVLERLAYAQPALVLVQAESFSDDGTAEPGLRVALPSDEGRHLFGEHSGEVEQYLAQHYQFDRRLDAGEQYRFVALVKRPSVH